MFMDLPFDWTRSKLPLTLQFLSQSLEEQSLFSSQPTKLCCWRLHLAAARRLQLPLESGQKICQSPSKALDMTFLGDFLGT